MIGIEILDLGLVDLKLSDHEFDKKGVLKLILQLPVSKVTSCTFGGKNFNELFITTASVGLNDIEAERQPHAGKLFKFVTQEEGYASNCYRSENITDLYH